MKLIMENIIIGNIFALISSVFMIISGVVKDSKLFLRLQNIELLFIVFSNLFLKGYTGIIVSIVAIIINILCYRNKLTLKIKIFAVIMQTILCIVFNNLNFIGLLPLFATIIGIFFVTIDAKKLKVLSIIIIFLWLVYDLTIQSYVSAVFDVFTIITSFVGLYRIFVGNK